MTQLGNAVDEDGRRARRDRNRDAVVEALLELYGEGNLAPSSDEIAARAGLSARSLFRYFSDVDDLTRAAVARQYERITPLARIRVDRSGPRTDRIAALAEQRARLFDAIGDTGIVSRMRAPSQPLIAAGLREARASLRDQIARLMAPELTGLDPDVAADLVAAADVVCSFEAYRLLRDDQSLPRARAVGVMVVGLSALFPEETT